MSQLILFVCFGNVHRSVLAEVVLKQSLEGTNQYTVSSRGIQGMDGYEPPKYPNLPCYKDKWDLTSPVLRELNVPLDQFFEHQATPVDSEVLKTAQRIIAMDTHVFDILHSIFPEHRDKLAEFSHITDSTGEATDVADSNEAEQHRQTNTLVVKGIRNSLVAKLLK